MDKKRNIEFPALGASEAILDMLASREDTCLSVPSLCRGGDLLGVSEQNIRVGLTRLLKQGKICKLARGLYGLSTSGNRLLVDITHWSDRSDKLVPWKKGWIGVLDMSVPRSQKTQWRHHCHTLQLKGFKTHKSGLHLRPDNLQGTLEEFSRDLKQVGLAPDAEIMRLNEISGESSASLQALWDVQALSTAYRSLEQELRTSEQELTQKPVEEAAVLSFFLGRKAIRTIIQDPLLPMEMMQSDARESLISRTKSYQSMARRLWDTVLEA